MVEKDFCPSCGIHLTFEEIDMQYCSNCGSNFSNDCTCDNPDVHTDENGINYCKKCKTELALLRPPK